MAKKSGLGHQFYADGYDISGDVGSIDTLTNPSDVIDDTGIDKQSHERIHGLASGSLTWSGFFNDATDAMHDALKALRQTSWILSWCLGTTRGDQVANLEAVQVDYNYNRVAGGGLTNQIIGESEKDQGVGIEWALLLATKGTHASATDETGIDNTAATSSGGVGFLHHFPDGTPTGTIEYDIEDSSDSTNGVDGSWANLIAFSDVATPWAAIAERATVAGNVDDWVRASTNGTFTGAYFSMSFRRTPD